MILKLKLQYFGHLMWRANSLEKTLMLEKIEGRRRRDRGWEDWMASLTQWTEFEQALGDGEGQGSLACCSPWGYKELNTTEQLNNKKWHNWISVFLCLTYWATQVVLTAKNLPANEEDVRDVSLIPGSGKSPGGGYGNPLQYSCLENPMDRGAWWTTVHRVAKQSDITEAI